MDRTDAELMSEIAAGSSAALGLLYDRHAPLLLGISMRILRNRTHAEDVLHDLFVSLSDRAKSFHADRGGVLPWLATSIRNLSIDRVKRQKRRGTIDAAIAAAEPTSVEATFDEHRDAVELVRLMDALSPEHRATLSAVFFEGLSYPELSERDGIPLGTVKSRAARALMELRTLLSAHDPRRERGSTAHEETH